QPGRACSVVLEGDQGQAYNEEAFRYLLWVERKRRERTGRPFVLLLLRLEGSTGTKTPIERLVAAKLFPALWSCVRETDFVGWYRAGRIAGAVLTEYSQAPESVRQLEERIAQRISEAVNAPIAGRLRLRICRFPPGQNGS